MMVTKYVFKTRWVTIMGLMMGHKICFKEEIWIIIPVYPILSGVLHETFAAGPVPQVRNYKITGIICHTFQQKPMS